MTISPNKKIYFASDQHFGAPTPEASFPREQKFVSWLDEIKKDAECIFLLGDLFDFWFEYRHAVPKGYVRLLGALAELADQGVEIHLFRGNHDLWYGSYLADELGLIVHSERVLYTELHGLRVCVGHGDGLGPGDTGYKWLRRFFTFPLFVGIFRWVHPDAGIGLAGWLSRGSRARTGHLDAEYHGHESEALWQWARAAQTQRPVDLYLFGHRHLPLQLPVGESATYFNLGEWVSQNTYLEISESEVKLLEFHSSPSPSAIPFQTSL